MAAKFIQIGVTAARTPTGEFLPSVPIFKEVTPEIAAAEERTTADVAKIFAQKMKQYIDSGGEFSSAAGK